MAVLKVGIIGLPNVGKSTLFNALMQREMAKVGPHPFTTVAPNKGMVAVPDKRLQALTAMIKKINPRLQVKPAMIEFVDIAGLVKGAAEGAGLGNQFLSHIREVDLILHVLREFENQQAPHVAGKIEPVADAATVDLELILADFEVAAKAIEERKGKALKDKKAAAELEVLEKIYQVLKNGKPAITADLNEDQLKIIKSFNLLTLKPVIFVLNIAEKHLEEADFSRDKMPEGIIMPVCVKLASDLYSLDEKDRQEFLKQLKIKTSGLKQVISLAYKTLGLITFYTVKGGNIVSAWPVKNNASVLEGAGTIHTDFVNRFVKAQVIGVEALLKLGSWQQAREKGLLHFEGKDYKITDADVIEFILN
jgi:ribosome-binding ATPase